MSLEFNKIAGAVLAASLGAMLIGKVAGALVHPHYPEKPHIAVQEAAVETKPGAAPVAVPALPPGGDAAAGKAAFDKKCMTCHTADKGGANKVGPNLFGIHGNKKAHLANFKYSDNMKAKGGEWEDESLNEFLWKPARYIPKTLMAFAGLNNDKERADVVAYLKSLK
jgi:cytochrome c